MNTNRWKGMASAALMLAVVALSIPGAVMAAQGLKERMRDRLPVINELKAAGVVGENNLGFLEFRGTPKEEAVVADENTDRRAVYEAIAKNQGVAADLVGRRRAAQLRDLALSGEWIQEDGGGWHKK